MEIKQDRIFRVYNAMKGKRKILLTENLTPKKKYFGEELIKYKGKEYRAWDPKRSKLAALILKGSPNIGIREKDIILYLGASHGYTVSFVSDIVGKNGFIFAIDIAPRVTRDLVFICEDKKNIVPILADANKPKSYIDKVSQVDVIYIDVAQRDQANILVKNAKFFLKKGGYAIFMIKSRSIDITKKPNQIYQSQMEILEKNNLRVIDFRKLDPFQKDHAAVIAKNVS